MDRSKRFRPEDVEVTHIKGSGPGGQHRNKRMTGIRAVHRPTGLVAEATERRSQIQNLGQAMERIEQKVRRHYHRPRKRFATSPTRSSQARRGDEKRRDSRIKGFRKKVPIGGD